MGRIAGAIVTAVSASECNSHAQKAGAVGESETPSGPRIIADVHAESGGTRVVIGRSPVGAIVPSCAVNRTAVPGKGPQIAGSVSDVDHLWSRFIDVHVGDVIHRFRRWYLFDLLHRYTVGHCPRTCRLS